MKQRYKFNVYEFFERFPSFTTPVLATLILGGGGLLPHMGYIVMCGIKGYVVLAVLVRNRVSILAILIVSRV